VKAKDLETRITLLENQLKEKLAILDSKVRNLEDIEEIEKLQRAYGYYLEHAMIDEFEDLFADDPDVALNFLGKRIFKGKVGGRRFLEAIGAGQPDPDFLHIAMQLSGIVNVDTTGLTAKGRWYGWGAAAIPEGKGVSPSFFVAVYEVEYIKENGKWKIKILTLSMQYHIDNPKDSFVKQERIAALDPNYVRPRSEFGVPDNFNTEYPSGYILPFHFKHPVTGKETSESKRNATLGLG
jgi:hypothetical protein